jgi:hypothetical protein
MRELTSLHDALGDEHMSPPTSPSPSSSSSSSSSSFLFDILSELNEHINNNCNNNTDTAAAHGSPPLNKAEWLLGGAVYLEFLVSYMAA